jgi:hypothetical protein
VFGVENGVARVYDSQGNGQRFDIATTAGLPTVHISEDRPGFAFAAIDDDLFGWLSLNTDDEWGMDYPWVWEIDATPDLLGVAACTNPNEGVGGAGLVADGTVIWERQFDDMAGYDVGVTEDGDYVTVGGAHYYAGADRTGQPSVRLYDIGGSELWSEETDEDVISVGVSDETEVVAAGTDDGELLAFDLDGDELWTDDEAGGWISMSRDGSTIVGSSLDELVAFDGESGDELWSIGTGVMFDEFTVSDDGSRVLAISEGEAAAALIDQGSIEWQANFAVDYMRGALAGDGSSWAVIMSDFDAEQVIIQAY